MNQSAATFLGYKRADGRVGVRNYLLILSVTGLTGPSAQRIGRNIANAVVYGTPYGSGLLGADRIAHERTLNGLATNPNVGAVLVIGADRPRVTSVIDAVASTGKAIEALVLDDFEHDALSLSEQGIRSAARLSKSISTLTREPVAMSELILGLECGRSDPSSGLIANPTVGLVADQLIAAGGSAIFGETAEWVGAEKILQQRAATAELGQSIIEAAKRREQLALSAGVDMLGTNPGLTNIEAGLSSIEEKSLGNILKGGHSPIIDLLDYAGRPQQSGLHVMDAPAYAPESITGFAAAGAQIILFTTGVGNSYVDAIAPTIKLSANPDTCQRLPEQLDFSCADAFLGHESLDGSAERLLAEVIAVASGKLTWGEILQEGGEAISRFGAAL